MESAETIEDVSAGQPRGSMATSKSSGPDWAAHIRRLGRLVRHARHVLNISQVDLARASGVSQGGVSRLEAGKGVGTPLVTFLKIYLVLIDELRRRDPRLLDEDMRELLATAESMPAWVAHELAPVPPVVQDPELENLIRIYREVPPSERPGFLSVMKATASTLASRTVPPRPPARSAQPAEPARPAAAPPLAELFAQLFSAAAKGRPKDADAPDADDVPPERNQ